jgi:hypothetical protein
MRSPDRDLGNAQKIKHGVLALITAVSAEFVVAPDVNAANLAQTTKDNQPNRLLVKSEVASPEIIDIQYPQFEKKKADYVEENFQIGEVIIVTIPPTDEYPKPSSFYAEVIAPLAGQKETETLLKWFDNGQEKSGLMGNENLTHLIGTEWQVALGDDSSVVDCKVLNSKLLNSGQVMVELILLNKDGSNKTIIVEASSLKPKLNHGGPENSDGPISIEEQQVKEIILERSDLQRGGLIRINPDNFLGILIGGRTSEEGNWQVEVEWYGSNGKKMRGFVSPSDIEAIGGGEKIWKYPLPPGYKLGSGWEKIFERDNYYPGYLTIPLNIAYARVASILGSSNFPVEIKRQINSPFSATINVPAPFRTAWGAIFIDENVFIPGLIENGADSLTHEMVHTRLGGWDSGSTEGFAQVVTYLTSGDTKILEGTIYPQEFQSMVKWTNLFYKLETEHPGFLKYWAEKTNEWRKSNHIYGEEYDGHYEYFGEELAKQWFNEYLPNLWEKLQNDYSQMK